MCFAFENPLKIEKRVFSVFGNFESWLCNYMKPKKMLHLRLSLANANVSMPSCSTNVAYHRQIELFFQIVDFQFTTAFYIF